VHVLRHLHTAHNAAGDAGVVATSGVANHKHLLLQTAHSTMQRVVRASIVAYNSQLRNRLHGLSTLSHECSQLCFNCGPHCSAPA
jgi:hypothetical protein